MAKCSSTITNELQKRKSDFTLFKYCAILYLQNCKINLQYAKLAKFDLEGQTMDQKSLGKRIKELRLQRGLNQEELGEKVKLTNSQISTFETGARGVTLDNLILIAQALSTSLDYLIFGKGEKEVVYTEAPEKKQDRGHRIANCLGTLINECLISDDPEQGLCLSIGPGYRSVETFFKSYTNLYQQQNKYLGKDTKKALYESMAEKLNDDLAAEQNENDRQNEEGPAIKDDDLPF